MNRAKEPRLVRILLSPQASSHDVMTTRIPLPRAVKEPKIVLPSAPKDEEQKLRGSSGWRRDHLKMLGVKFYAQTKLDFGPLTGREGIGLAPRTSSAYISLLSR